MITTDEARAAFPGGWILPDDADYDEARATFNGDDRPAPGRRHPPDLDRRRSSAAVRWAAGRGPRRSPSAAAATTSRATPRRTTRLVIDLRHLREVVVDPERRAGAGRRRGALERRRRGDRPHGLAMTGGTFGDTGVGGLALGGGLGFLMGTDGLTCDHLVGAEVVTADGSVVIAGEGGDPDLLWALRGGGGNFGIVTPFEFALHPVGPLHAGHLAVPDRARRASPARPWRRSPHVMPRRAGPLRDRARTCRRTIRRPAARDAQRHRRLPGPGRGGRGRSSRRCAPLPIVEDGLGPMTYLEVQACSGQLPFGLRHYWKGHFVRELDASAIDATVDAMRSRPGVACRSSCIEAISGAARHEPPGGAAFGQREARWNVSGIAIWEDPAEDDAADRLGAALRGRPAARVADRGRLRELRAGRRDARPGPRGVRGRALRAAGRRSSAATTRTTSSAST